MGQKILRNYVTMTQLRSHELAVYKMYGREPAL